MSEDLKAEDLINFRERLAPPKRTEPPIDKKVSEIVGKDIRTTDPRLIKLIAKWKQESKKTDDPNEAPDNFLEQEDKIKELKETFI